MIQRIHDLLSSLPGVVDTAVLRPEDIPQIKATEESNQKNHLVPLRNLGMQEVMERNTVFVILKDRTFRPPPSPTVYMVEEVENEDLLKEESLEVAGRTYRIVGEEVMDQMKAYSEKHVFFEHDFVLFPDRRRNRRNVPAFLVIPPIPFPELEKKKDKFSIKNIMSVSPSTRSDEFVRSAYNLSKLTDYATVLIGWDTI